MLSFFEMCNLLQKQREKLLGISEAGEFLTKFGKKKSDQAAPEQAPAPAAAAKPKRTKKATIIPTSVSGDAPTPSPKNPNVGKISYSGYRVKTGEYDDNGNEIERPMTPEEIQAMQDREREEKNKQIAMRVAGRSGAASKETPEQRMDRQGAWVKTKEKVLNLSNTMSPEEIADEVGISLDDVNDILEPVDINPFTGSEDAKPKQDNSDEVGSDYTGDTETIKGRQGGRKITARGMAYFVDKVMDWNNYLASPVYQEFTKMAAKALSFPYVFPPSGERFQISLDTSKGVTSGPNEVVMNKQEFMQIVRWVRDYLGFDGKVENSIERNVSYRQALASEVNRNPESAPMVARALDFEKVILSKSLMGKKYTIKTLADALASKALAGGLNSMNKAEDTEVVGFMIETSQKFRRMEDVAMQGKKGRQGTRVPTVKVTALERNPKSPLYIDPANPRRSGSTGEDGPEKVRQYQRPFDFFVIEKGADLSNPNTVVYIKSKDEMFQMDTRDDEGDRGRYPSMRDQVVKSMEQEPRTEATEWIDLMNLMEYWDK